MLAIVVAAGRLSSSRATTARSTAGSALLLLSGGCPASRAGGRRFASRERATRSEAKTAKLLERFLRPVGGGRRRSFPVGRGVAAGASALALGSLCFYGAGMSERTGAIDAYPLWPEEAEERVRSTYLHFGGGHAIAAVSAVLMSRSPLLVELFLVNSLPSFAVTLAALLGSGWLVHTLPYEEEGFGGRKRLAWIVHCSLIGGMVCPLVVLGGPILLKAALYTAGIVGGLTALAASAPDEKFLRLGGPLAMGLGVVFVATIGSVFLPATTAVGAGLYSLSLYGGLVVFGGFLLYDTQKIIANARDHPADGKAYDPINEAMGIYMDSVHIFMRVAQMLFVSNSKRK